MRHVVVYLILVYLVLFLSLLNRQTKKESFEAKANLRVFAYSSFTNPSGPGPKLKEIFEKSCQCYLEFVEGNDAGMLLQRLKLESQSLGADLVIGFDQYDLQRALSEYKWRKLDFSNLDIEAAVRPALINNYFVPYDWGILGFIARKNELKAPPKQLDDLLHSEFTRKIALQDPRSSSPGLQFLFWVIKSKGEEEGLRFIQKMFDQVHSYSPSWSMAYGLFQKNQANLVYSYVTSPLYHDLVEKNPNYESLEFKEPLAVQYEFLGIPEFCKQCELAEKFVNLMLSVEGQKIIMEKNFMFPVLKSVKENTPFQVVSEKLIKNNHLAPFDIPSSSDIDRLLKRWSELRRGEKN